MCIGCRSCVAACIEANGLSGSEEATRLSAGNYTVVEERGEHYVRRLCMHCVDPACASVCPVGALRKTPGGPVTYAEERCIGCRYCMLACPFNVPRYDWHSANPAVRKCQMCVERQRAGKSPACAEACPVGATIFGTRRELLAEARSRVAGGGYVAHVFGESEVGGTCVLYCSPAPFSRLGFRTEVARSPLPSLTWDTWLRKVPGIVMVGGTALAGIGWLTRRRELVELVEKDKGNGRRSGGDESGGGDD